MKRKNVIKALALSALSVLCFAAIGCEGGEQNNSSVGTTTDAPAIVECGEYYDVTVLFEEGDNVTTVTLKDESGKNLPVEYGKVIFPKAGKYTLTLQSGNRVVITVADTKGPVISRTGMREEYFVGQIYDVGFSVLDANDGEVTPVVAVTFGEQPIEVNNGMFTPTQAGTYTLSCTAKDVAGNTSEDSYEISVQPWYELASAYNFVIEEGTASASYEVIGEKRYLKTKVGGEGFSSMILRGADLDPYCEYTVTATYDVRNYETQVEGKGETPFELFLSKADKVEGGKIFKVGVDSYIVGQTTADGEKSFTFEVTTNADGQFYFGYKSLKFYGSMELVWLDVSLEKKEDLNEKIISTYQFGQHTMTLEKGTSGTDFICMEGEGDDLINKHFETRTLKAQNGGYVTLTMKGSGFQPNTYYTFDLYYDWELSGDSVYAFFILHDDNLAICTAWGKKTNTYVSYEVKTNSKGEYTAVFKHLSLKDMCRIKWLNVSDTTYEQGKGAFDIYQVGCEPQFYGENYAYKVTSDKTVTNNLIVWVDGENNDLMYDVYADIKHSYAVGNSNWGIQLSSSSYVTADGRYYLGRTTSIDAARNNKHCFKITAVRNTLSGDNYALFYNFELKPVYKLTTQATSLAKKNGSEIFLDAATLGVKAQVGGAPIHVTVQKTDTLGTGETTIVLSKAVNYGDKLFTVEKGCSYTVAMHADVPTGGVDETQKSVEVFDELLLGYEPIARAAGMSVTLDKAGLGLKDYPDTSAVTFKVTKTEAAGTEMDTVLLENAAYGTAFTVESGYFYEIYVTARLDSTTTLKEYVYLYEETIKPYTFQMAAETLVAANNQGVAVEAVTDEFGNRYYKLYNTTGGTANQTCNLVTTNKSVNGYKVYADFIVITTDETAQSLSFNDGNWTSIKKTVRACIGTVDSNGAFRQMYARERLDGVNNYVLLDNVVFVPNT